MVLPEGEVTKLNIPKKSQNFEEFWNQNENLIKEKDALPFQIQSKHNFIQSKAEESQLENILNNPGLVHLAENIFGNLSDEKAEICRDINQSSKQLLGNPIFWLRKFKSLSQENQKDWIKLIKPVWKSKKIQAIISYLQWSFKEEPKVDLPCYTRPDVQDDFREGIMECCKQAELYDEDLEKVKILAPLTDNPNAPNEDGITPIHWAAGYGYTDIVKVLASFTASPNAPNPDGATPIHVAAETGQTQIIKILAPLTDNPNAPDDDRDTPIHLAAGNGYTEIVKILAPLLRNPNAPNKDGVTPIHEAADRGYTEIVKFLAPLTDNPNVSDKDGETPIYVAAKHGHTEIVTFLAPLTDNPNASDEDGETPIYVAAKYGHTEIVKFLAPLTDNPNASDKDRETPIYVAAKYGHTEIVKFLAPLTDNPNAPNNYGNTPTSGAKNAEICRILETFITSRKSNVEPSEKTSMKRPKKI